MKLASTVTRPSSCVQRTSSGVHVLKHENVFMMSNAHGDIRPDDRGLGLYDSDTRCLSRYDLRVNGVHARRPARRSGRRLQERDPARPIRTSSAIPTDEMDVSEIVLRRQSLGHRARQRSCQRTCARRSRSRTTRLRQQERRLTLALDADFADIFELRGAVRRVRGERLDQ